MTSKVDADILDCVRRDPVAHRLVESVFFGDVLDGPAAESFHRFTLRQLGDRADDYLRVVRDGIPTELVRIARRLGPRLSPLTLAVACERARGRIFHVAPVHRVISDALVDAVTGQGPRFLLISMPPRHGKSTLATRYGSLWYLANFVDRTCAVLGYGDDFTKIFGRMTRNDVLDSPELFPFGVAGDSSAASAWSTTEGGGLWTAGVSGQITGKGCSWMCADDVLKNLEDATSRAVTDELWNWWQSTAFTRLSSSAVCCVIGTRWSELDLHSRILKSGGAAKWRVLNFPCIAEKDDALGRQPGELLVPAMFGPEEVATIRGGMSTELFETLYQQRPLESQLQGRVYHAFDERANVRPCDFDPDLGIRLSFDWNVNPMTCVIGQVQSIKPNIFSTRKLINVEILDMVSLPDSNTESCCQEVHNRLAEYRRMAAATGRKLDVHIFGDASGAQRRSSSSSTDIGLVKASFRERQGVYGQVSFHFLSSNPPVKSRVNAVNGLLLDSSGTRRLLIHPKCAPLITDLKQNRWKRDSMGNTVGLVDKSDSQRTHSADALGYLCFGVRGAEVEYGEVAALLQ